MAGFMIAHVWGSSIIKGKTSYRLVLKRIPVVFRRQLDLLALIYLVALLKRGQLAELMSNKLALASLFFDEEIEQFLT